jgi:hypothetical protein
MFPPHKVPQVWGLLFYLVWVLLDLPSGQALNRKAMMGNPRPLSS